MLHATLKPRYGSKTGTGVSVGSGVLVAVAVKVAVGVADGGTIAAAPDWAVGVLVKVGV